jgi:hypothetical protein
MRTIFLQDTGSTILPRYRLNKSIKNIICPIYLLIICRNPGVSLDKVIPVYLSADKWEQIREEARKLGVGPTTLARMWIFERLRQQVKAR